MSNYPNLQLVNKPNVDILHHLTQRCLGTVSDENCGGTTGSNEGEEMISEPGYEQMGQCSAVSQTVWSQHMHDLSDWL